MPCTSNSEQIDIEIDTNSTAIYESIEVNNPYNTFGKGLVMASLNVNSLLAHIDELKIFTSANALDVLIINETRLDSTIDNQEVNITGYEIIRNDRKINGRKGGGVCIYVRCNINYILRDDLEIEKLESLVIQVNKPRSKPILISTWYRPPDTPTAIFDNFEELIAKMDSTGHEIFLLGDFNVDFMPHVNANNTNKLKDIFSTFGLEQLITEPTRVTVNSSTLIDLLLRPRLLILGFFTWVSVIIRSFT